MKKTLRQALVKLYRREPMTTREVGLVLGITRQAVSRIEWQALRKIRAAMEKKA